MCWFARRWTHTPARYAWTRARAGCLRTGQTTRPGPSATRYFVPRNAKFNLTTHNGGVHVSGVHGMIGFSAVNGGVHLAQVGGSVKGKTVNGGMRVTTL